MKSCASAAAATEALWSTVALYPRGPSTEPAAAAPETPTKPVVAAKAAAQVASPASAAKAKPPSEKAMDMVCGPCAATSLTYVCNKCKHPCSFMKSSAAGGSDITSRVCNYCNQYDSVVKRQSAKGDNSARDQLKTLKGQKRIDHYVDQRTVAVNRENSGDVGKKRTLEDAKMYQDHGEIQATDRLEKDGFITFRRFACDAMTLGECKTKVEAEQLWVDALSNTTDKMQVRGQWLLGEFQGVDRLQRETDELRVGMKSSGLVEDANDIDAFEDRKKRSVCETPPLAVQERRSACRPSLRTALGCF